MDQGSDRQRVISRVLDAMQARNVSYVQLGARLRFRNPDCGWSQEYVALRLGELLPSSGPGRFGGRVPLTGTEIEQIADALRMPVDELLAAEPVLALATAS